MSFAPRLPILGTIKQASNTIHRTPKRVHTKSTPTHAKLDQAKPAKPKIVSQPHIGHATTTTATTNKPQPFQAQRFLWPFMNDFKSSPIEDAIRKKYPTIPEMHQHHIQSIRDAAPYLSYMPRLHLELEKPSSFYSFSSLFRALSPAETQEYVREERTRALLYWAAAADMRVPVEVLGLEVRNDVRAYQAGFRRKYAWYLRRWKVRSYFAGRGYVVWRWLEMVLGLGCLVWWNWAALWEVFRGWFARPG